MDNDDDGDGDVLDVRTADVGIPGLRDLLEHVTSACDAVGADVFIVGALARDLLLKHTHGIEPPRITRDVDTAVAVSSWTDYTALRRMLIEENGFEDAGPNQRLVAPSGTALDLVPFGGVADAEGRAGFPPEGTPAMTVLGFPEAQDAAVPVRFDQTLTVNVASLEGLGLLKLIAWADRPHERTKDAQDLCFVMREYYDARRDLVFRRHSDLFDDEAFDLGVASARIYGREVALLVRGSPNLQDHVRASTLPFGKARATRPARAR